MYWRRSAYACESRGRWRCVSMASCPKVSPPRTWRSASCTVSASPAQSVSVTDSVPDPGRFADPAERESAQRALAYMDLNPGMRIEDIKLDRVFIGSCTNSRIEDLRQAAQVVAGKHVAPTVRAMVVPGSTLVKQLAEAEGLDRAFKDAGFEWREA